MYTNSIPKLNKIVNTHSEPNSLIIKTYFELNAACLKSKKDKELILYYQLRLINKTGSGYIPFSIALEKLQTDFHYSESSCYRLFSSGKDIFFEYHKSNDGEKIIKLLSLEKVCTHFKVRHLSLPTLINLKDCTSRQKIRAWLYKTIFKTETYDKPIHPIAHKTIECLTGLKTETQQRYNKVAHVKSKPNYTDKLTVYNGKSRQWVMFKQLGNSYSTDLEKGNKGMSGHINKNLKNQFSKPSCSDEAHEIKLDIRFYHNVKQIKGIIGETYLLERQNAKFGLWSKC